ncbi:class 1 fructose-bisphosphatase [Alisedimentitalea sp. MJ-SS2]|uniref:class 1 fructose-bisphosphatase n=1 Tax=Aliisedimentitalea sp. MJ-SS2 TaxID=3049795 RepID=UPI0029077B10|nr:class 1 fructose-bisphosphatase [Alisedimentitalea sp. MJ-SS2]MDU8928143.1 class 1 fructose-bisphosphatase [Alisedimentitalea sp. MJ-SS2]
MTATGQVIKTDRMPAELAPIIEALCEVGIGVADIIAKGALAGALGAGVGENTDGDQQKALDVMADEMFAERLKSTGVRYYASEEQEDVVELNPEGDYALAIDPLDGSSNIDVNVSIGTIFSIFKANDGAEESFLRKAREQLAGGYIIFGPATALVVTFGDGTQMYTLDRDSGEYILTNDRMEIPATSKEFAINASNYRHWTKPVRAYIDDCLAGDTGPRDRNYNMRWVASLVAETHRILTRGGVFLYPGDARPGYERGRLRMVYECAPMAFLVEQASGKATDGCDPILDQTAESLHARTPLVFGSSEKVDRVATYHDLPDEEVSALFGQRGLFRG